VIKVTEIKTKASLLGILFIIFIVGHGNVHITTININHTSAANGINIINDVQNTTKSIKNILAEIHDILFLHQFDILIIDCPIIAHHHIAQKKPHVIFATHCHIASLFHFHLVSVNSSIRLNVISDSVRPIIASITLYGKTKIKTFNKLSVINGI